MLFIQLNDKQKLNVIKYGKSSELNFAFLFVRRKPSLIMLIAGTDITSLSISKIYSKIYFNLKQTEK